MDLAYIILDPDGTMDLGWGLNVIVEAKTGVTYANQVAGNMNELRTQEGFLIPVGNPDSAKVIYNWFWQPITKSAITRRRIGYFLKKWKH